MLRRPSFTCVALLGLGIVLTTQASASLVPCGAKDRVTGLLKNGAGIHMRTACKPTEVQISTADLGVKPQAVVRDAAGALVGAYDPQSGGNVGYVLRKIGADTFQLQFNTYNGSLVVFDTAQFYHVAADCSDARLQQVGTSTSPYGITYGTFSDVDHMLYVQPESGTTQNVACFENVSLSITGPANCGVGQTFLAPHGCVNSFPAQPLLVGAPVVVDVLSGLVEPFHLSIE